MASCQGLEIENTSKEDLEMLLLQSCRDGQKDVVDFLLSQGVCLDCKDDDERTPLILASEYGHCEIVLSILDHGVRVSEMEGLIALLSAFQKSHFRMVKILIERGVSLNLMTLIVMCKLPYRHGINLLMEHGAYLNANFWDKEMALKIACRFGYVEIVEALLEHGAAINVDYWNIDVEDIDFPVLRLGKKFDFYKPVFEDLQRSAIQKETALMWACMLGDPKIVELLIKHGVDVNARGIFIRSPLSEACCYDRDEVVQMLIENGASVDEKDELDVSLLMRACYRSQDKIIDIFLEGGANVNARDMMGMTAIMYACEKGNRETVEKLIEKGAEVNDRDQTGNTVLLRACLGEDATEDLIELLIEHNANVNARCDYGISPVMALVRGDLVGSLQMMLHVGANLDFIDEEGMTVFSYALQFNRIDCLRILLEEGKLLNEGRLKPVHKDANIPEVSVEVALMLIELGLFEWDLCSFQNFKPMSLAALESGLAPGKIKYDSDTHLSPLVLSLIHDNDNEADSELTETFLKHRYYFPEDYRTLCTYRNSRECTLDASMLDKITLQPISLTTWCLLTVSNSMPPSCLPGVRSQQVESLPIPNSLKRRLCFK